MYFTQFLRDVGIDATDELKEQADSVLFSVTPRNQEEALEHIKIALEIYLRLPSNPTVSSSGYLGADIEVQRLVANIHHLQGQLALASAIIQQKDLLIQQQKTIIKSGEVLIQSIQKSEKKEDKEPLLGKVLSVKKLELWKTLELDVPTLLRYLKQYFKNEK
ncbi:hypothetical protein [Chroococcidiopsis sp.]|uniref:hypothetical protein n=1 Tax=Chroococcidiopsis sp. TaxID=3088168 RepID=UPI003F2E2BE6